MVLMFVLIGIGLLFMLGTWAALGVWTYRDAKAKGLDAGIWTAIVIMVPNLLGLLLYFVIGRKQQKAICRQCGQKTELGKPFCSGCGEPLMEAQLGSPPGSPRKKGKMLLITALASAGIAGSLMISAAVVAAFDQPEMFTSKNISIMQTQTARPGVWKISFRYFDGEKARAFVIKDGKPQTFHLDAEITKGSVELGLSVDGEEVERLSLNQLNGPFTYDLSGFPDKSRVVITLYGEKARGKLNMSWKE